MTHRRVVVALALVLLAIAGIGAARRPQGERAAIQPAGAPVAMPLRGSTVRLTFGLKDTEPTDWDGEIRVSPGRVERVEARLVQQDRIDGSAWRVRSRRQGQGQNATIRPAQLMAILDAPPEAKVEVAVGPGRFSFTLGDLPLGGRVEFLEGAAAAERLPVSAQITASPDEEDFPACATGPDGTVWCAFVAYRHGTPIAMPEVGGGRYGSLETKGNGDQVQLMRFDGRAWSAPMPVTDALLDVWRPTVAVDGAGVVWVLWAQNAGGDWDLFARGYDPRAERWTDVRRLTTRKGADLNVVAASDRSGRVWLAWRNWDGGRFRLAYGTLEGGRLRRIGAGGPDRGNVWNPCIVTDAKGNVTIAYDTYARGSYDVELLVLGDPAAGTRDRVLRIAASPRFEARPSLAVDRQDRVWVAYEDADANWGKDYGSRWEGKSGVPFYLERHIVVRCVDQGRLREARAVEATPVATSLDVGAPGRPRQRLAFPRLGVDGRGRLWLLFRRHPLITGAGERWASFAIFYNGDRWSPEIPLPRSDNLLDNRPALATSRGGALLAVYSSDGRTVGTNTAAENNLSAALLDPPGEAREPALVEARPEGDGERVDPVHPNEDAEIQRIRSYRATVGGRSYRLFRGEFHRHTELSSHRDQDGPFEEIWRYGLDVARMDWIGPGDHDNGVGPGGVTLEYTWWLTQKQVDMYHHPPTFVPMYTYERSVVFPSGHRNVMFARRGIRPLPRLGTPQQGADQLFGTPEGGSPDVKNLYAYLKFFDGICSAHTTATNMGTDWRDNDPQVEPVVEIYQGHRQNYEEPGAPKTAKDAADSIGGYQPAGYVWNAFAKGYRLGFQVSSDHISTHTSYAIVFAEQPTRSAIVDAFKKRHSYGANDNILLDVRCGDHMMGDQFTRTSPPRLEIIADGTAPIARVDIVRQIDRQRPEYVYAFEPKTAQARLSWTDSAARPGALNMYYVRLMQQDGKMAWASPMWIEYRP